MPGSEPSHRQCLPSPATVEAGEGAYARTNIWSLFTVSDKSNRSDAKKEKCRLFTTRSANILYGRITGEGKLTTEVPTTHAGHMAGKASKTVLAHKAVAKKPPRRTTKTAVSKPG